MVETIFLSLNSITGEDFVGEKQLGIAWGCGALGPSPAWISQELVHLVQRKDPFKAPAATERLFRHQLLLGRQIVKGSLVLSSALTFHVLGL